MYVYSVTFIPTKIEKIIYIEINKNLEKSRFLLLVHPEGFEPPTPRFEVFTNIYSPFYDTFNLLCYFEGKLCMFVEYYFKQRILGVYLYEFY